MLLYPRLTPYVARRLANERASLASGELVTLSALHYQEAIYATTGGNRVDRALLGTIQTSIRDAAMQSGYPHPPDDMLRRSFDATSAVILHKSMGITPAEASSQGVWAFMACVVLPDVVRWRFPSSTGGTNADRFLGGSRGLRNTFGRVWWRAHLLRQPHSGQPYRYLDLLGEDELVQITERPNLAGSAMLAGHICESFLATADRYRDVTRSELLRDAMKRLRRLLPVVSFDALDEQMLQHLVDQVFGDSAIQLRAFRGDSR